VSRGWSFPQRQQIKIALLGIGAAQNRPEDTGAREAVAVHKLPQFAAMRGQRIGWLHNRHCSTNKVKDNFTL